MNVLKIDKSFITGIEQNIESREIARLIVMLAHLLQLKVIAEGVETLQQRAYLEQFGCEYGQGCLFSEPVDRDAIQSLLNAPIDAVEVSLNSHSRQGQATPAVF